MTSQHIISHELELWIYTPFLIVSILMSFIIPFLYFKNKRFRKHPAQIFLILCILEGFLSYLLFIELFGGFNTF